MMYFKGIHNKIDMTIANLNKKKRKKAQKRKIEH